MTPKTVYYKVTVYNYKPPREAIIAQIINNMHTVQLAVEDYNTIYEGIYPKIVSEFFHLLPSSMVNPINNEISPVVNGANGKSG